MATANLKLNVDNNGVSIASVDDDHVIFIGDGKHYQTYDQFSNGKNRNRDNYTLRDPHVVEEENGDRYLNQTLEAIITKAKIKFIDGLIMVEMISSMSIIS